MSPSLATFADALAGVVGAPNLRRDPDACWPYGYDNSRRHALPALVAHPADHNEVREAIRLCNRFGLPLVARGAGTGTAGAAVPPEGGLVLALDRLNRILQVDPANRLMVVEPGVTNRAVQEAAREHGFFWPPDPTSSDVCTVGGNLACNAAGPRAVKYGTPRENTLALRLITGSGDEMRVGVHTTKGVVGYDLTRLMIGSEGTLGVITEAVLRLTPLPEAKHTLRGIYRDIGAAARAVSAIMGQPVTPCALELMDRRALELVRDRAGASLPADAGALLMIEVDGAAACVDHAAEAVAAAARVDGALQVELAKTPAEVAELWQVRRALSPALRNAAPKKINEDVVVPVSRMPELIAGLEEMGRHHRIDIVNFGHAGNGNIHVNLLFDPEQGDAASRAERCLGDLFDLVLQLEGTLSGEHGIGLVKRDFVASEIGPEALALMHALKSVFDPNGLLNPGKKLPLG